MTRPGQRGDIGKGERFLQHVSNTLGWLPRSPNQRRQMVDKVNAARAENPALLTWDNLYLTVEYLRVKRTTVGSPMFVLQAVKEALTETYTPPVLSDIAVLIEEAIGHEQSTRRPGWDDWAGRLFRAAGSGRQEAYDEWVAAGRAS